MFIQSITTSVNYADLLSIALPRLRPHVDRCLVVTSPEDRWTYEVAREHGAEVQVTDAFHRGGASFAKGRAIGEAAPIDTRGWILCIDADIVVPPDFWHQLESLSLDERYLYSALRRMAFTPADWSHVENDWGKTQDLALKLDGELPGCFHLFHAPSTPTPWYPVDFLHAAGYDSAFESRYRRVGLAAWLPFQVVHLGEDGQNWHGRLTAGWSGLSGVTHWDRKDIEQRRAKWLDDKTRRPAIECKE